MALDESFSRRLMAATAADLEIFVHHLVALETTKYVDHDRYGASGDMGRDVAGFLTIRRHEGEWHNFQCKQYRRPLNASYLFEELGKLFYYSSRGHFILPSRYVFVVPNNFSQPARDLLDRKSELKRLLLDEWDERCARRISKGANIPLDDAIREKIVSFDFDSVESWEHGKLLTNRNAVFAAAKTFGDDPGDAPRGLVPEHVDLRSEHYGEQLRNIYSEHDGHVYSDVAAVLAHPDHGEDFQLHRRRYFDAIEFDRYFSIKVDRKHVDEFRENMFAAVTDVYKSSSGLTRVRSVMSTAGAARIGGLFDRHSRVTALVRQGTCHVFANEGTMPWWKAK
uniref:ABC-three component systems C-terminal domain-containing protein n=1 Tax=Rhodopseudomonas palustris (strain BisA53) TaxID=316055 RepID=Q07NV2_RHOP5